MIQKLRNYRDLFGYHRERSAQFAEHDHRDVYLATRARLEQALGRPATGLRLLDVGCGQRFPATLLFTAAANDVTGIDTDCVVKSPSPIGFVRVWRSNGFERAVKTLARQLFFDPAYYGRLAELSNAALPIDRVDVRQLSVTERLPFDDSTFDAIISNAVFEHVPDVPAAIREVERVLKPGGVCHIGIHLYPSLSGGHHMRWAFPDVDPPADIPPWDHLRENRFPTHVYLNELTEKDYRTAFDAAGAVEVTEWLTTRTEGEALLTPEIEAELGGRYSRDDLLKREVIVIGRRRARDCESGGFAELDDAS